MAFLEVQMKHVNIPIFIPHLGCPNNCVFCNQRSISGKQSFRPESVREEIEAVLSTLGENFETEIAFFGGSFTGIDRELMIYLLETAQEYIDCGKVKSIRLSTRPDYISDEILSLLKKYEIRRCFFGHIHSNYSVPTNFTVQGILFQLISAYYLEFVPQFVG